METRRVKLFYPLTYAPLELGDFKSAVSSYPSLCGEVLPSRSSFWSRSLDFRIRSCSSWLSVLGGGTTFSTSSFS